MNRWSEMTDNRLQPPEKGSDRKGPSREEEEKDNLEEAQKQKENIQKKSPASAHRR
jgi:hypothetical protein